MGRDAEALVPLRRAVEMDLTLQALALRDSADLRKAKRDYARGWRTFDAP